MANAAIDVFGFIPDGQILKNLFKTVANKRIQKKEDILQ